MDLASNLQLLRKFPNLRKLEKTSEPTDRYNCIAWAAGDNGAWWWPDAMGDRFWPQGVERKSTIPNFIRAFETLGYQSCSAEDLTSGVIRVALFANDGLPTHAARQRVDGLWTSKLGPGLDIKHRLRELEGKIYGKVVEIMECQLSVLCTIGTAKHAILTATN